MQPYVVYWTHDDGMDQHELVAMLTPDEADMIESRLYELGAIDYGVTDVLANASSFSEVNEAIDEDLLDLELPDQAAQDQEDSNSQNT